MKRKRPQITNGEVIKFLSEYPKDLPVYCAPSMLNIDEPEDTQEFIYDDDKTECVAIESDGKFITFGFKTPA